MDLLRFSTAGSVDDGKSTLIGRLLYDSKSIFEDQLAAVERASRASGEVETNLALLTDGLRAEREQKITIDVAYRYFATPRRKFIVADTPGHEQYTRNMVTGASNVELAIVLVDASKGLLPQSKRHAFIASLLQIPHVVVAINKMDLIDFAEETFERICDEFRTFAQRLDVGEVTFIPISALRGDNVVDPSDRMPWYRGATLLYHLETVNVGSTDNALDFRFPVQTAIRPDSTFRGLAGRVASGSVSVGQSVLVLPSRTTSRVRRILTFDGELERTSVGDSVVIELDDDLDVSRGDCIVRENNVPSVGDRVEAFVCWMSDADLEPGKTYLLLHGHREVPCRVEDVLYRIDVESLHRTDASHLGLNEIGRVRIRLSQPIAYDPYRLNHRTGSFVLVDPSDHRTIAAGIIRGESRRSPKPVSSSVGAVWQDWNIPLEDREIRNSHRGCCIWLTGLSGAGKSSIGRQLERRLFARGAFTMLLDGDQLRHGLNADLGFEAHDRTENVRRAGEVAGLFVRAGCITICTFVSPFAADRDRIRASMPEGRFIEVAVEVTVEEATRRDPKGLYARQAKGELFGLTGVDAPYEPPQDPELRLDTESSTVDESVQAIEDFLRTSGVLKD